MESTDLMSYVNMLHLFQYHAKAIIHGTVTVEVHVTSFPSQNSPDNDS